MVVVAPDFLALAGFDMIALAILLLPLARSSTSFLGGDLRRERSREEVFPRDTLFSFRLRVLSRPELELPVVEVDLTALFFTLELPPAGAPLGALEPARLRGN